LNEFSDEELIQIIKEQDTWNKIDFLYAKEVLKSRGIELDNLQIEVYKTVREIELSKPEKNQLFLIIVGYAMAFLGGLLAILIGIHLRNHRKILPSGVRFYSYTENDRKHGKRILIIGSIVFLIVMVIRIIEII
jgi:hypothetical protein